MTPVIGRRTRLTPKIQQKIVEAIARGVPFQSACLLAGVPVSVGKEWRARGEGVDPDRPSTPLYAAFADAVAQARAIDEDQRVQCVREAGYGGAVVARKTVKAPNGVVTTEERFSPPDWQAASWHLERCYPDHWGRKDRLDIHLFLQQIVGQIASEYGLETAELLAEAERLLAAGSPPGI